MTTAVATHTRKKKSKKVAAKKPAKAKGVPTIKDVLAQHNKCTKAEKIWKVSHAQATSRKKEWEGAQADLGAILEDIRKGQGGLY